MGKRCESRVERGSGQMFVSGVVRRAVVTSGPRAAGVSEVAPGALAEVGVGRDHHRDLNQPGELAWPVAAEAPEGPPPRDWTPAQPDAPSRNSATTTSFRDGVMATPSAAVDWMVPPASGPSVDSGTVSFEYSIGMDPSCTRRFRLVETAATGHNSYSRQNPPFAELLPT